MRSCCASSAYRAPPERSAKLGQGGTQALENLVDPALREREGLTSHVREMAANLVLGRALQILEAACGMVVFREVDGRWNTDRFVLPGRPDHLERLGPALEALVKWTLHAERPVAVDDLGKSRWTRHLLRAEEPPTGSVAAAPLAQRGEIWGAIAVYRPQVSADRMDLLRRLVEVATEPLSTLDARRPEGVGMA